VPPIPFPYATVVLDPITSLQENILAHMAIVNSAAMLDARAWAGTTGAKVQQVIATLLSLPCHVVILMHTTLFTNEKTQAIVEEPTIYGSSTRGSIFKALFPVLVC
jgi:hypothetical protein